VKIFITIILALGISCVSAFADTVSVVVKSADILNKPSVAGSYPVLHVPLNYPLQIIDENNTFYKVSDFLGRVGWISKVAVSQARTVVVSSQVVNIRKGPGTDRKILFKAFKGVAFKVLDVRKGWLKVAHESGKTGWLYEKLSWSGDTVLLGSAEHPQ